MLAASTCRTLSVTQSGFVIARSRDGLGIIDAVGSKPFRSIECDSVHDFAPVGDHICVVHGQPPVFQRFEIEGTTSGAAIPLVSSQGRLIPVATGPGGVMWSSRPSQLLPSAPSPAPTIVTGEADLTLPLSLGRWCQAKGDELALHERGDRRWSVMLGRGARVVDGAILLEGRLAAVVVQLPSAPAAAREQLVVFNLHNGEVQHRLTLAGVGIVRFAPPRGIAVLRIESRRLVLLDLRFGRVIREYVAESDVLDLAIDCVGQHLILRHSEGLENLAYMPVRMLMTVTAGHDGASPGTAVPPPAIAVGQGPAVVVTPELPVSIQRAQFHDPTLELLSVPSLRPRPSTIMVTLAESSQLLERHRAVIAGQAGLAIAHAWDEGRLSFPAEGKLPFDAEVSGLLGITSGLATSQIRAREEIVIKARASVRAYQAALGSRVSPLAAMAQEFGLSALAQQILMVVAAPAVWGRIARLYAILANDEDRGSCDEALVCAILGSEARAREVALELDREAPLLRYGLLRPEGARMRPFVSLVPDALLLRRLRFDSMDADLDDIRIYPAQRRFADLLVPGEVKDGIVMSLRGTAEAPLRIVVRGRVGSGRHTLLAAIAERAGRRLGIIDVGPTLRDLNERARQLRAVLRRTHLLGVLPCLDGLESLPPDDRIARDILRDVLAGHHGALAVRLPWDAEVPLEPGFLAIDLPALTIDQRSSAWSQFAGECGLSLRDPSGLATRYSVGPGVISRVCAQVAAGERASSSSEAGTAEVRDASRRLENAVRQSLESRLGSIATRVKRLATWSQVILPPDIQDSLLELIARIRHRRTVFETWGFDRRITTARGVTALFQGGPGTGKTLVAGAIANELNLDLYRIDLSRVMSKWIGETEQNLARLFDAAEDGHAILLFDEADSLFTKRTEVRTSVDRYANIEVNYLLQRLDTFEGIAILTTNFGSGIDAAFRRRLSLRLTFPFPDEEIREQLWRAHLPEEMPTAGEFDLAGLARRYRVSGGYIRNAALRAAFLAAEEQLPLSQEHLERAIRAEFREIGTLAENGVLE